MLVKTKFRFLFIVLILAAIIFTTCDSPMGMGKPIDWLPPVLTVDPKPPTPMYVGLGTTLTGTVTDNDMVSRVVLRDSVTGVELFTAVLLPNNQFRIDLAFSPAQNGDSILADVVAFDRAGNSGAESIVSVVLIIDIRPPLVEDIWVQRTSVRTSDLYSYGDLFRLEKEDPNAEISKNVEVFQNGAFFIKAKIKEEDTALESVTLKLYDSRHPDTELLSLPLTSDSGNLYAPQWYLTEDVILNAGDQLLPIQNYKTNYKDPVNNRYYYRVRILAVDKGKNDNDQTREIVEEKGYFCLWNKADFPKGILDPKVVGGGPDITVTKGSQLPVEFFDDDKIDWAYAGLFTKEQWEGTNGKLIAPSVSLSTYADDDAKFEAIKNRLLALNQPVYNWRYDRYNNTTEPLKNLVPADGADEKLEYIGTGKEEADYGDFVFVSLVRDKKLAPHVDGEYPSIIQYRKYNVNLVDENAPLIVFDKTTTGHVPGVATPEENTFPTLTSDGKFTIHGYTLREDKGLKPDLSSGNNKVEKFRMAWVPFSLASTDSQAETKVKDALEKPAPEDKDFPAGVQWWNMDADITNNSNLAYELIGSPGSAFRKQYFAKTFSILGGADDKKGSQYDNFRTTKGGDLENKTKLFIFYAEDNMGHKVSRQFYLLGNTTPPTISVYDITGKVMLSNDNLPPSVYTYDSTGNINSTNTIGGKTYITALNDYIQSIYSTYLKDNAKNLTDNDKPENYRAYPRGTTVKLWADAKANGGLGLSSILMQDITYEGPAKTIGYYNTANQDLGYVENFPDITQRVFMFTATDQLGNEAKVQRTIAIAPGAALIDITTPKQNGTYPKGEEIELRANFDGMIKLQNNTAGLRPKLNVLYQMSNATPQKYGVRQIECEPLTGESLYLTFRFTVPENAQGTLQTVYSGIPNKPAFASHPSVFPAIANQNIYDAIDRPLTVNDNCKIFDSTRETVAYTPGNVTGFNWTDALHSLQYDATKNPNGKTISLDGVIPTITSISMVNTKAVSTNGTGNWYLKSGESISFQLTASKPLKVNGTSHLRFRLQRPNNAGYTGYDTTNFEYRKVTGSDVVFTLDVSRTSIPNDGILQNDITLVLPGNITDTVGNPIDVTSFTTALTAFNISNTDGTTGKTIYFDLTPPPKPVTSLTPNTGAAVGANPTTTKLYNTTPTLGITNPTTTDEPYEIDKRQYSLDGGLYWVDFPTAYYTTDRPWTSAVPGSYNTLYINNGQWNLKTRFIDRAGNEGATTDQSIYVNNVFPKLLGVSVIEPKATYIGGDTLNFTLDFDDVVTVPATGVTMTLNDITVVNNTPGGTSPTYSTVLTATQVTDSRTVTFTWKLTANTFDMLNGLKITSLSIGDLKDKFGNSGPTTGISFTDASVTVGTSTVNYNFKDHKVSTIIPTIRSREPQNAQGRTGNITQFTADTETVTVGPTTKAKGSISTDNKTIRLNFSKPMQKGNGTITIRPHTSSTLGYAIPAVFENDGYYVTYTYDANDNVTAETKSSTAMADSTYVSGFYDIFNSVNATDKTTLIGSTSMSAPKLSNVTGLSVGPYLKTTHGLSQGAGYTGNYGNNTGTATITQPGINAPGTRGTNYMIPDVNTKWVLNYLYDDLFSVSTTAKTMPAAQGGTTLSSPSSIRAVLDRAKWRWQEIPVTNTNVTISDKTVTITLSEPLLPGLQWDVDFTEGTFTDEAGNKAAEMTRGTYWFWSKGVQKPVIRVDRKSYDARAGGANANYSGTMFGVNQTYNASGYNGTIVSFDTIAYRITSETPQARLFDVSQLGKNFTQGGVSIGSITAAWTGRVTNQNITNITNNQYITWNGPKVQPTTANDQQTIGTWVRPNLIFRNAGASGTNNASSDDKYYIMEEGLTIEKAVRGGQDTSTAFGNNANNNRYYGFRSYNKDATYAELNDLTVPNTSGATFSSSGAPRSLSFDALEASKNYVVAQARIDHTNTEGSYTTAAAVSSLKGFEGVFRTVMAMNQTGLSSAGSNGSTTNISTNNHPVMVDGTNVRSGTPTISGFPVRDNGCASDSRYTKVFFRDETTTTNTLGLNGRQFYWVSSEIISPWYVQPYGSGAGGGSHGKTGDVEDWITAGYGDLTFVLNLAVH